MQKKNENKKNKKVVVVAAMALLLALVGISGGETYAKYASSQTDNSSATVAKWGYTVSANAKNLFGKQYGAADSVSKLSPVDGSGVNVVGSSTVIAPGTTGNAVFQVNGTAEVKSKVEFNLELTDIVLNATASAGGTDISGYKPLDWSIVMDGHLGSTDLHYEDTLEPTESANDFEDDAEAHITSKLSDIAANESLELTITLTWDWDFEGDDLKDTVFGGLQYKGGAGQSYLHSDGVTYTDNISVFTTSVNGSILVSQIQDEA